MGEVSGIWDKRKSRIESGRDNPLYHNKTKNERKWPEWKNGKPVYK